MVGTTTHWLRKAGRGGLLLAAVAGALALAAGPAAARGKPQGGEAADRHAAGRAGSALGRRPLLFLPGRLHAGADAARRRAGLQSPRRITRSKRSCSRAACISRSASTRKPAASSARCSTTTCRSTSAIARGSTSRRSGISATICEQAADCAGFDSRRVAGRPGAGASPAGSAGADVPRSLRRRDPRARALAAGRRRHRCVVGVCALQHRRRAGAQGAPRRRGEAARRRRSDRRADRRARRAARQGESRARLRVAEGRSRRRSEGSAATRAPGRPAIEQGAARRRLGGLRREALHEGARAVARAARPEHARRGSAGILSGRSVRVRAARCDQAGGRAVHVRRRSVRRRSRSASISRSRRFATASCSTRSSPTTRATRSAGTGSSQIAPGRAGDALPVSPARDARVPGRPEELSRPAADAAQSRDVVAQRHGVRGHGRHASPRVRAAHARSCEQTLDTVDLDALENAQERAGVAPQGDRARRATSPGSPPRASASSG